MRKCVLCHNVNNKGTESEQRLCFSLLWYYNISRFYSRNFKTLASFCGCGGLFVSGLVGNAWRHVLSYLNWMRQLKCRLEFLDLEKAKILPSWHQYNLFYLWACSNVQMLFCSPILAKFHGWKRLLPCVCFVYKTEFYLWKVLVYGELILRGPFSKFCKLRNISLTDIRQSC